MKIKNLRSKNTEIKLQIIKEKKTYIKNKSEKNIGFFKKISLQTSFKNSD